MPRNIEDEFFYDPRTGRVAGEATAAELEAINRALRHELEMLRADFNDCNAERARWRARAMLAETQKGPHP
jgi:hypothetical protein